MTGEAVEKITELAQMSAKESLAEVAGETYTTRKLTRVSFDPTPETLTVHTLSAFARLIFDDFDKVYQPEELAILIESPASVKLVTRPVTSNLERAYPLEAVLPEGLKAFTFGQFIDLELFTIALASLFEPTPDLEMIASYIRKVDASEQVTYTDDGVTQVAQVRRGASGAVTDAQQAPRYANLRPYRTFREIDQPESRFLFRLKTADGKVGCALFEADGGSWRISAAESIAEYFRRCEITIPVLT